MSNYKEYPNKGPSSRKNGDVTLTSSKLTDTSELIVDFIVRRLPDAECIRPDIWTATCPVCGVPERTLIVAVLSETREVGIKCFGQGCPRADILAALGIDPDSSGLHKPKTQPWSTYLELLSELGDTPEHQIQVLEAWFSRGGMNDSRHDDPDWKDFLRHCASGNPAFYNKLVRLMTEQRWPQAARDNYLVAIGIEDPAKSKTSRYPPAELQLCPALPDSAKIDAKLAATACPWLDGYIQYSQHCSPRGYEGFHEACGLWLLATTAARRLVLYFGDAIYTNLMIALVARTTIWAKTSTAKISLDLLKQAGLGYLLAPNRSTPQAFLRRLTGIVSPRYGDFSTEQQDAEKLRLAFAAQRGWYFEEWGSQLQAMRRKEGPMQEFHGLLRTLDDGFAEDSSDTIARGLEEVSNPYLSLLCSATPADLAPFASSGSAMWTDGFWPRFALIAPPVDAPPSLKRRPRGQRIAPTALVRDLQVWHEELGVPRVCIETVLDAKGHNLLRVIRSPLSQRECVLTDEVEDAFYRYNEALIGLITQHHSYDLDGCYGRFHVKALRIAMLLASLQNEGRIEMRHWARGQQIAERWRHNLHNLVEQVSTPSQPHGRLEETVLRLLARLGPRTIRELQQNTRQGGYEEVTRCVHDLVDRGVVTCEDAGRTQRYHLTESATKCRRVDGVDV